MKKVVICIPTLDFAGAEMFVVTLSEMLDKSKYEVIVLTTRKTDKNANYDRIIASGSRVESVGGGSKIKTVRKVISFLKKERPDVVHINVNSFLYVAPAFMFCKIPARLYTVHSMAKHDAAGKRKKFYKYCFDHLSVVPVAINDTVRESVMQTYGLEKDNVPVVYNGIDTEVFKPGEKDDEHFTFVTVGTLYHVKNHRFMIDAFSKLSDKYPNAVLKIVGDGDQLENLKNQVSDLGLDGRVFFPGKTSHVENVLAGADVYLNSSLIEGMPLSVLEAMAAGLPLIAVNVGGIGDIVDNDKNGYLLNGFDAEKYAAAMASLIDDPEKRKKMGETSRAMSKKYDVRQCAKAYSDLYEDIISKRGAK